MDAQRTNEPRTPITNPKVLAEVGERIYRERYQRDYEEKYRGKFVAINVETEKTYIGDTPEEAFQSARKDSPEGLFHLIRIGYTGVFRAGHASANADWIFR